jgi:hypothetical protein
MMSGAARKQNYGGAGNKECRAHGSLFREDILFSRKIELATAGVLYHHHPQNWNASTGKSKLYN